MKIYIPKHLRKIIVVDQMCKMIEKYSEEYSDKSIKDSFDYYNTTLKLDPVYKFINLLVSKETVGDNQEVDEVINYLSNVFYCVKGTRLVLNYLQPLLGLDVKDINYTTSKLEITLNVLETSNLGQFTQYFKNFLSTLLYFQDFELILESAELKVSAEIDNYLSSCAKYYKEVTIDVEEV